MKTIRQTATIRGATPHDVYETIMDSKRHTKLSQQPTTVSRKVGGAFKIGHDLEGKHLALTKDKRIVQTWRANNWPKGTYSKATFALARTTGGSPGRHRAVARARPLSGQARHDLCYASARCGY